MENIKFIDDKICDIEDRGYIMYRKYNDGIYVLMGSYTNKEHRSKGVWKNLFNIFLNDKVKDGEMVQAAACSEILTTYLLKIGFIKIDEPVRHWGNISNGVNLVYIKNNK